MSPCDLSALLQQRRRRQAAAVHALGPAPMLHLLVEVANGAPLDDRLAVYAALPADFIRDLGGDRFASASLAVLEGGRK